MKVKKPPIKSSLPSIQPKKVKPAPVEPREKPVQAPPVERATRQSPGQPDLSGVPSNLEANLSFGDEGKSTHEVLGVLVEAHVKEAEAILGRTRLNPEDVNTVSDGFLLAKHGIGGDIPEFNQPMPFVSEWMLTKLRALPSVGGKSRAEFVEAWQNSAQERARREQEERQKKSLFGENR